MNSRGRMFRNLLFVFLFGLILTHPTYGQKASAEFISSKEPAKLLTGEQVNDGIQNIFFKDFRLYVTNVWSGLQVLDVTSPENPRELGVYRSEHRAHNVFVHDKYAYMSEELYGVEILDISNPSDIVSVGRIRTKGDAFWVVAEYPYVYVAEELLGVNIYDISDLNAPKLIGNYDTPRWAWGLFIDGSILYVADKNGGLIILDISNPALPVRLGQYAQMSNAKTVQVDNGTAYVANGPDGLWIVNVTNPKFPSLISRVPIDGYVYNAYKAGNSLYLANELRRKLEIVDVTDLKKPVKEADYVSEGKVYAVWKNDVYVYIAADDKTIIVRHNHPPVITQIENQTVDENVTLALQAEAFDPDGDAIHFEIENLPKGAVFDTLSGAFSWTPDYEQSGDYPGVTIKVIERTASELTTPTTFAINVIHVNRPPSIPEIPDYDIDENKPLAFVVPEGSDPDKEDKGLLTYTAESLPEGAIFDPKTRKFNWTPTFEQSGVYTIDFLIHDPPGALMREGATITVRHIDRKPTLEPIMPIAANEANAVRFTLNGSDPDREDQDKLSYLAQNLPAGSEFNPATAEFSWTPTYDQSGEYKKLLFIFKAGAMSDSINVDISVANVNRPPVLADLNDKVVKENSLLTFSISGSDPDKEDVGKLKYSAANLPKGSKFNPDSLMFSWVPDYEQSGEYQNITFTVKDVAGLEESKTMNISVEHVNRPPVLAALEPKIVDENAPLTFSLSGSDPDIEDTGKLIYSASGLPEGAILEGQAFSWTPTFEQSGTYTVEFTVSDGRLTDKKKTVITVNHVNRMPVLADISDKTVNENVLLTVKTTASDPDKEDAGKWILSAAGMPEGAVFNSATGEFSWTPTFEQSGAYVINLTNTDPQGLSVTKNLNITVNHVNRTPVFADQTAQTIDENADLKYALIPATDPDKEDAGKIIYSTENLPKGASFDPVTLNLEWIPTFEQSGTYTVTLKAADGEFAVTKPLNITVNHVNRAPQLAVLEPQTIDENSKWTLKINFTDPDKEDNGKIKLSVLNLPNGAVFDPISGVFTWTPGFDQSGEYPGIKVTAADPGGLTDEKTFDIKVNHVDRPPVLTAVAAVKGIENTELVINLTANDPDAEDQGNLIFEAAGLPEGSVFDSKSGLLTWKPNFLQAGQFSIEYKVTDTGGLSDTKTGNIIIDDLNRAPVMQDLAAQTVKENSELTFMVNARDEDTDNTLTYSAANLPDGSAFDPAEKTFTWKPGFEQAGTYKVSFKVSDGKAESITSVDITVENVNRPPKFTELNDKPVDENKELSFKVEAADDDQGTTLIYSVDNLPNGSGFDKPSRFFTWKPGYDQSGKYSVAFNVSDGETSVSKTVNITVNNVNRKPGISGPSSKETEAGSTLTFSYSADDPDGDNLSYSASGMPAGSSLDSKSGEFKWTPAEDQAGESNITVTVSDGTDESKIETRIFVKEKPAETIPVGQDLPNKE
ncbi:MAG: putative Ig domain-containing protein [Calditrichaceae bacterium]